MFVDPYLQSIAEKARIDPLRLADFGNTIATEPERSVTRIVTHTALVTHDLILAPPFLAKELKELAKDHRRVSVRRLSKWLKELGATNHSTAKDLSLAASSRNKTIVKARRKQVPRLDPRKPQIATALQDLIDRCSAIDVVDATIKARNAHQYLFGVYVNEHQLSGVGFASDSEDHPGMKRVGVLVDPAFRNQGIGKRITIALGASLLLEGLTPVYRCHSDNKSAIALGESAGYRKSASITSWQLPQTPDTPARLQPTSQ